MFTGKDGHTGGGGGSFRGKTITEMGAVRRVREFTQVQIITEKPHLPDQTVGRRM